MTRRRLLRVVNLLVALGLATLVVWTSKPWEVWTFERGFLAALAGALVIDALLVVVWAHRHAYVLRAAGSTVPPRRLLLLVTFSNTANNLTPAASGEVVRAWFLKRNFGVPIDRAGGAIVFERLFLFGLMAVTATAAGVGAAEAPAWLVSLAVAAIPIYVFALPALVSPLAARSRGREASGGRVKRAVVGAANEGFQLWGRWRVALGTALWTVGAFACQGAVFWLAASNSGLKLTPLQTWALVGGATAVGVISALPFGLGAAELSAAGIGALLGIEATAVASAFVLYRLFLTFPLALAGSYAYAKLSREGPEVAGP